MPYCLSACPSSTLKLLDFRLPKTRTSSPQLGIAETTTVVPHPGPLARTRQPIRANVDRSQLRYQISVDQIWLCYAVTAADRRHPKTKSHLPCPLGMSLNAPSAPYVLPLSSASLFPFPVSYWAWTPCPPQSRSRVSILGISEVGVSIVMGCHGGTTSTPSLFHMVPYGFENPIVRNGWWFMMIYDDLGGTFHIHFSKISRPRSTAECQRKLKRSPQRSAPRTEVQRQTSEFSGQAARVLPILR